MPEKIHPPLVELGGAPPPDMNTVRYEQGWVAGAQAYLEHAPYRFDLTGPYRVGYREGYRYAKSESGVEDIVAAECLWEEVTLANGGLYKTSRWQMHLFLDGTPAENNYVFCPYCGLKIRVVRVPARRSVAPGVIMQREIAARGWTLDSLAWRIARQWWGVVSRWGKETCAVKAELISIVDGHAPAPVTLEVATWLGTAFGTSMEVWLNLEEAYREGEENDEDGGH